MVNSPMKTFYPIFFLAFRRILHWCPWACKKGGKQCGEDFFLEDASFCFLDVSQNSEDSGYKSSRYFFLFYIDPNFADTKKKHPIGKVRVVFLNIKDLVDKFGDMVDKIDGMEAGTLVYIYICMYIYIYLYLEPK